MLSDALEGLSEHFAKYRDDGVAMEPESVKVLVGVFNDLAAQAWNLENHQVSVPARLQEGPRLRLIQGGRP